MSQIPVYRGRFAPSPTGPLHIGSLIAAVGSYLEARVHNGEWLVRMEDLDAPRTVPGAADDILRTLELYGFQWDGEVMWQSQRMEAYQAAIDRLAEDGQLYPCACSRKDIAALAKTGVEGPVYPGTCRLGIEAGREARSLRVRVASERISIRDRLLGTVSQLLDRDVGDFILRRTDTQFAYQLAVVVDDADQGITEVVRGSDLLNSTPRQVYLQQLLRLPTPSYLHLPVAINDAGTKLSKQTFAPALDKRDPLPALIQALSFLGHPPPDELHNADTNSLWQWALQHWQAQNIPAKMEIHHLAS
jgi:glutamyl-Q tRNA(Asp) synthetase